MYAASCAGLPTPSAVSRSAMASSRSFCSKYKTALITYVPGKLGSSWMASRKIFQSALYSFVAVKRLASAEICPAEIGDFSDNEIESDNRVIELLRIQQPDGATVLEQSGDLRRGRRRRAWRRGIGGAGVDVDTGGGGGVAVGVGDGGCGVGVGSSASMGTGDGVGVGGVVIIGAA